MKHKNQWLALLLSAVLIVSLTPTASVRAAEADYDGTPVTPVQITAENYADYQFTADNYSDYAGYYGIRTAAELYGFAALVNSGAAAANGVLTADVRVNANVLKSDGSLNGDGSAFYAWTPIGVEYHQYTGTFDGRGHTVSGLYFHDENVSYAGLLGNTRSVTVKNVALTDSWIYGLRYVGGIVGLADRYGTDSTEKPSSVSGCSNAASVGSVCGYVGGVAGLVNGNVKNCVNTGRVSSSLQTGTTEVGGVVGAVGATTNTGITVENCCNTGGIRILSAAAGGHVGGVVGSLTSSATLQRSNTGHSYLTAKNCYSTGKITVESTTATVYVGGLFGQAKAAFGYRNSYLSVENGYSRTAISVSDTGTAPVVGGLIGYAFGGKASSYYRSMCGCVDVKQCYYPSDMEGIGKTEVSTDTNSTNSSTKEKSRVDATATYATSAAAFAGGEVCFKLNGGVSDGTQVWYQTLGVDPSPRFAKSADDDGTVQSPSEGVYQNPPRAVSVNISWTTMNFTYTEGEWHPESHQYAEGVWRTDGGTVTVENNGTAAVTAEFGYTPAAGHTGVSGAFSEQNFDLASGESNTTALTLSGRPSADLSQTVIGDISVKISEKAA